VSYPLKESAGLIISFGACSQSASSICKPHVGVVKVEGHKISKVPPDIFPEFPRIAGK
jgi:hypothetical protein